MCIAQASEEDLWPVGIAKVGTVASLHVPESHGNDSVASYVRLLPVRRRLRVKEGYLDRRAGKSWFRSVGSRARVSL